MKMILAAATTESAEQQLFLGKLLLGLWVLLQIADLVRKWTAKKEVMPQPMRTQEMEHFATREELMKVELAAKAEVAKVEAAVIARAEKLEQSLEGLRDEMKADRNDILAAGDNRARALHGRIDEVMAGLNRVMGKVDIR